MVLRPPRLRVLWPPRLRVWCYDPAPAGIVAPAPATRNAMSTDTEKLTSSLCLWLPQQGTECGVVTPAPADTVAPAPAGVVALRLRVLSRANAGRRNPGLLGHRVVEWMSFVGMFRFTWLCVVTPRLRGLCLPHMRAQ